MSVPPGVSEADFAGALEEWKAAVGTDWVFTSDTDLDLYRDGYSPFRGEPEERIASAAVAPASVEQVQAVVRVANRRRIPLYPISTGRNLTYGGAAPVYSGSVVIRTASWRPAGTASGRAISEAGATEARARRRIRLGERTDSGSARACGSRRRSRGAQQCRRGTDGPHRRPLDR
jgi:FAD/FMN-containing dehydrogenase